MGYDKIILDKIENEKKGIDYCCNEEDKGILNEMFEEINSKCGTHLEYLAEIDSYRIPNSGFIIIKYLDKFNSESVKGYLIPQIVSDKVNGCAEIILSSYLHFKQSKEYISDPGEPSPSHIYVRYDNAFRTLKPRRLSSKLIILISNPRDAFYLPFTMRMLAAWRLPQLENILYSYINSECITLESVGLSTINDNYFPPISFIRRELLFSAIDCLKYYPTAYSLEILRKYSSNSDRDISVASKKALQYIKKKNGII